MAYDNLDAIISDLTEIESAVCNLKQACREMLEDEQLENAGVIESHDVRVYEPQTPEQFEAMESASNQRW